MRVIELNAYKFSELDKVSQEKALNHFRNQELEFEWYDYILDDMISDIKEQVGVEIPYKSIEFEILSRSNNISISSDDIIKVIGEKYPNLIHLDLPKKFGCYCNYLGGGMCSSLLNSEIKEDICEFEELEDGTDEETLQNTIRAKLIIEDLEKIQEIMAKTYKSLYDEYSYRYSDEYIKENIELNDYEFNVEGDLI